ncbi:hypothetical protein Nepgr_014621 [Nepenthes gracilis]|uniref:H(+)-exporting diphosphatase n=1 Tax=Nepenthes gracilis TaxID=150966 RepID=A0AAD3XQN3_NEPGR|nr:hypothetical protein Nepgr_014621 [Nepenthes gracilis]
MCITITKDACQASYKVDTKIDRLRVTGVNMRILIERYLLKGMIDDENIATQDNCNLGYVNVRYGSYIAIVKVEGFSTCSQPCTYDKTLMCKPTLATTSFSIISFLLGAITSVAFGYLGKKIATYANARTTLEARKWVDKDFIIAFRSGAVIGFLLATNGLLVLYIAINLFKLYHGDDWGSLFESITGYGLSGSFMALFDRVGGGIYTKAADIGADLDNPRNLAIIANNIGGNVGDIASLFGSYAMLSCATLIVASISSIGVNHDLTTMMYTLLVSLVVTWVSLLFPFTIFNFGTQTVMKYWQLFLCVSANLWVGLIIGFVTEYYISNAYSPVQDVADACRTEAATNVIFGLALGYKSIVIPIFAIIVSLYVTFTYATMYDIAIIALGMLSTIATSLAIEAYGPISDNAGGIVVIVGISHRIREGTDSLDTARNTTSAIGIGISISFATLVSFALSGAFVSRASISIVDVLGPKVFISSITKAMFSYEFSAITMKSIRRAALKMVIEAHRQFNTSSRFFLVQH